MLSLRWKARDEWSLKCVNSYSAQCGLRFFLARCESGYPLQPASTACLETGVALSATMTCTTERLFFARFRADAVLKKRPERGNYSSPTRGRVATLVTEKRFRQQQRSMLLPKRRSSWRCELKLDYVRWYKRHVVTLPHFRDLSVRRGMHWKNTSRANMTF